MCRNGAGLFCANFYWRRGSFTPCRKVWCGPCYGSSIGDTFLILALVYEDGFESVVTGDERQFKEARNGDNIMTPFQCDLCHFRNIQQR
jgi:hypothetical protein